MATYVNDLRVKEIGTGESSGTWGTETNVNLELIGEALSFGTEAITTNADTHTSTVADGSTDPARSIYIKYTGTLDSACTITIAPNTISRLHFIENGTSGSQNIIISQGSGANVTIPPGDVKVVYLDGAGSGAAVVDAFASLSTVDLKVQDDLTVTDDASVGGDLLVSGEVQTANIGFTDGDNAITISDGGSTSFAQTLTANAGVVVDNITIDGTEIDLSSGDLTIDVAGDIKLDAAGNDWIFLSGGTAIGRIINSSSDFVIQADVQDKDIIFKGDDGGSGITALTIDMSAAGASTFNSDVTTGGVFNIGSLGSIGAVTTDRIFIATADGLGLQLDKDNNRIVPVGADGTTYNNNVSLGSSGLEFKNIAASGTITGGATTLSTDGNTTLLELISTDADANVGPILDLTRNSSSPADSDELGLIRFLGENDADGALTYARIGATIADASNTTEDGTLFINTVTAGANRSRMLMNSTETVFNEASVDLDFRVESNGATHALFVDGGNDCVGINTSTTTSSRGELGIGGMLFFEPGGTAFDTDNDRPTLKREADGELRISAGADSSSQITFFTAPSSSGTLVERLRLDKDGDLLTRNSDGIAAAIGGGGGNVSIRGRSNASGTGVVKIRKDGDTGNMIDIMSATTLVGSVSQNGSSTAFNTSSDYRLKENITDLAGATDRLKQLAPKRFNFIADADTTVDGFIAHEVSSIVPEAINGTKDEVDNEGNPVYQGIDQSKLVPLLVATIQELEARIKTLEDA
jgi:hypothetical protein